MTQESGQAHNALTTLLTVKKFHAEGKYCDVVLQVNGKLFKCQRSLLAANSEYFDTMFSSTFKESKTPSDEPITLHELDAEAFEEILHFIYTGDIRINDSNVCRLLLMSDFLRLSNSHIKEQCIEYVRERLRSEKTTRFMSDALELFCFAHMKAESKLVDVLTIHICQRLNHYSEDAKLVEIPFKYLTALLEFSNNYINLSSPGSQNVVLKIIHNWVNYKHNERKKHRCELMKYINFQNVSSDFMSLLMNSLNNFIDEVTSLPECTQSLEKLKNLKVGMVHNLNLDKSPIEGTIVFVVKPYEMKMDEALFSSTLVTSNFEWKMSVTRLKSNDNLSVYFFCKSISMTSRWYCYANFLFTLLSQKEGKENFIRYLYGMFSSNLAGCGLGCDVFPISWNELIDSENGYINGDGSVTFQVLVRDDVPFLLNDLK